MITILTVSFLPIMNFDQMVMFLCDPSPTIFPICPVQINTNRELFEAMLSLIPILL